MWICEVCKTPNDAQAKSCTHCDQMEMVQAHGMAEQEAEMAGRQFSAWEPSQ